MWEAIRRNRRRSTVLITLMGIILILLGFVIGMLVDPQAGGAFGAVVALGIWLILWLTAIAGGDSVLLASSRAKRVQKKDAPRLWNIVEEMTIASGLGTMPAVYIIEDSVPNAFAVGRKPEKAAVAVTSGLLKRLNRDELQGVIAHEIGHIKNLDIRFMTLASVMLGSIVLISEIFVRGFLYSGARRRSSRSGDGGQAQVVILVVALLVAILAPIVAQILYFACSRQREYLADASAARFTRFPEGLASALERISRRAASKEKVSRALAPLYIVNPLQARAAFSLFSTHPDTKRRVAILRGMAGAGFADYENAYKSVSGGKRGCIGERTLASEGAISTRAATPESKKNQDAIEQAREVGDILGGLFSFLIIPCACGVRIKIPPEFKRPEIPCPRCGRKHPLSSAKPISSGEAKGSNPEPLRYRRTGKGWEDVECSCGKTTQLSPGFAGDSIRCSKCKRTIEIIGP